MEEMKSFPSHTFSLAPSKAQSSSGIISQSQFPTVDPAAAAGDDKRRGNCGKKERFVPRVSSVGIGHEDKGMFMLLLFFPLSFFT